MKVSSDPLGDGVTDYIEILEGKKPAAAAQIGGEAELSNDQRRRLPYIVALYRQPCTLCDAEPPCVKFLPFKTDNPTTPWIIAGVCRACAMTYPDGDLQILVALKLREGSDGPTN